MPKIRAEKKTRQHESVAQQGNHKRESKMRLSRLSIRIIAQPTAFARQHCAMLIPSERKRMWVSSVIGRRPLQENINNTAVILRNVEDTIRGGATTSEILLLNVLASKNTSFLQQLRSTVQLAGDRSRLGDHEQCNLARSFSKRAEPRRPVLNLFSVLYSIYSQQQ